MIAVMENLKGVLRCGSCGYLSRRELYLWHLESITVSEKYKRIPRNVNINSAENSCVRIRR